MPIFGKQRENKISAYGNSTMNEYASRFARVLKDIVNENSLEYFTESKNVCMREDAYSSLRDFFVNESYDTNNTDLSPEEIEDQTAMMEQQFENDRSALLEYAPVGNYNPVVGMSFPMHKYLLMNNVFDNGGITKAVAETPSFTISMEKRYLVTPEGKEIDLFYEQGAIKDAVNKTVPFVDVQIELPEQGETNLITAIGAGAMDHIAVESYISAIKVTVTKTPAVVDGDGQITTAAVTEDVWVNVNYRFTPGYGDSEKRYIQESVYVDNSNCETHSKNAEPVRDFLSGMLFKDRLQLSSNQGVIKAVKLTARKDTSNGMTNTCSVKWKSDTSFVDIGTAVPINIPISPEEIKDVQALYGVNQLSKIMSMLKDVMGNWKDDSIREELDKSYAALPKTQKFEDSVNFAVTGGYHISDPATWRHTVFMDQLDSYATQMIQVWNDPNVDITVIGRTDLIRKISPVTYNWSSSQSIGGIALDYKKTVFTSDNRRYEFISSDKIRANGIGAWNQGNPDELLIMLKPRGTNRIMYIVYDYQFYVANDIRNAANPTLPAVHMFDRWKFYEYQPVQGRITVKNPTGFAA